MNHVEFMRERCQLPVTDLGATPFDKDWKGTAAHLGPHRHTPLRDALEMKTTNALLSVIAGSLHWAQARLGTSSQAKTLRQLAEATCLYGVDPLYLNPVERFFYFPLTDELEIPAAVAEIYPWILLQRYRTLPNSLPVNPPIIQTAEAVHLTRFLMPKRLRAYDQFIRQLLDRLDEVAPLPDPLQEPLPPDAPEAEYLAEAQRVAGEPLSPLVYDFDASFDAAANTVALDELTAAADWKNNPFLRSPDEVKALGFEGEPYRFTP